MSNCPHCGCDIEQKPKAKPRSVPQHRRYFAMIKATFSHWPEDHRFKPATEEHLRKWLQAKAGYANIKTIETQHMTTQQAIAAVSAELAMADPIHFTSAAETLFYVIQSKSIDFETLPHRDACALFDAVHDVIEAETDLKVAKIMPPISQRKAGKVEMLAQVPL
jgi:hypothetical protein